MLPGKFMNCVLYAIQRTGLKIIIILLLVMVLKIVIYKYKCTFFTHVSDYGAGFIHEN